jgi:exopolyphosphatase/guanosine-5'-triphosphate,3'-diphosphate pyrophosphatase
VIPERFAEDNAMTTVAAIDIGTNSTKMTVVQAQGDGVLTDTMERSEVTRLGEGVGQSGTLNSLAIERTLDAVVRFADEARAAGVDAILTAGTSALRDASNSNLFLQAAREQAGLEVEIIAGDREAQLAYAAVRHDASLGMLGSGLLVFDIGGGSTELITGSDDIENRISLDIGAVRLTERFVATDPPSADATREIEQCARKAFNDGLPSLASTGAANVVGIGGTAINVAAIVAADPDRNVHGAFVTLPTVVAIYDRLRRCSLVERRDIPGLEPARADVIVAGVAILAQLLDHVGAAGYAVSLRGMRYGLILQYLVDHGIL